MIPISKPEWWEKWTYFDKETISRKLKDDAPEEVREEWEEYQEDLDQTETVPE